MVGRREEEDWIIHSYSAERAVADGVLVEVDSAELREEMGYRWPVRLSQSVAGMVEPSEEDKLMGQSKEGRLWDPLFVSKLAIKGADPEEHVVPLSAVSNPNSVEGSLGVFRACLNCLVSESNTILFLLPRLA